MDNENLKIRRYLLGSLNESETESLDLQIISEEGFEDTLHMAEHELIEDYLEKNLTREESELFHRNFLVSSERKRLLQELSLLRNYAKSNRDHEKPAETPSTASFFEALKNWFSLSLSPAGAGVFGLLLIGLLVFGIWQIFYQDSLSPLETEYAALNRKDFRNPADFQQYSNITLSAGTFRNVGGATARSKAESLTESVFFRLALPAQTKPETLFQVELLKDGKSVFSQKEIRVYQNENGQEIRLLLPKSALAKGAHQIRLLDTANAESTANYSFTVE